MPFIAPLALLSALIIGPIIIAMYLLRLRREERRVSSTMLWRDSARDVEADAPWQRLRPSWLLLLQLLLLALLALALARPFFAAEGSASRNLIIIIDRSASMGATDIAPTRLAAALQRATDLVDRMPDGGRTTLITVGGAVTVPASATADRQRLRDAITAITPAAAPADLGPALTLASAIARRQADTEVVIISDGGLSAPADLIVPATVRYLPIGNSDANAAVAGLVLRTTRSGQTLFAQVVNYGATPVQRRLDLFVDDRLVNAYDLALDAAGTAGAERAITFDVPPAARVAEARLIDSSGTDALPLDDRAWAVASGTAETEIRIVGPGNRFLATALGLLPGVRVTSVTSGTLAGTAPLTIYDRTVPDILPPGNLLFIAPPRSTALFSVTGTLDFPQPRPAAGAQPLLRGVGIGEISILRATSVTPGSWARTVVESENGPLLLAGERDGRRIALLTFALQESDLPLQVAFPLLMANLVDFLAPGGNGGAALAPGDPLVFALDAAVTTVQITTPNAVTADIAPAAGVAVFGDTTVPGIYRATLRRADGSVEERLAAINAFLPAESRIAPAAELAIQQQSGLTTADAPALAGRSEFWRWLAALALALLVLEWLVYRRGALAALRVRLEQFTLGRRKTG